MPITITGVNADDTVKDGQLGNFATGTNMAEVERSLIVDQHGTSIAATGVTSAATQVNFDIGDMIAANMRFGTATYEAQRDVVMAGDAGTQTVTGQVADLIYSGALADTRTTWGDDTRTTWAADTRITWDYTPPAYSPEVQAVFDRMSNLTQQEMDAIEAFVDGMVADGDYSVVYEIMAWQIRDSNDSLTGFKVWASSDLLRTGTNNHLPGEGWKLVDAGASIVVIPLMNTWGIDMNDSGCLHNYRDDGDIDTSRNNDYWGHNQTGGEVYLRTRSAGNGNDMNAIWYATTTTPRPAATGYQVDDTCGLWSTAADSNANIMSVGGVIQEGLGRTAPTAAGDIEFAFGARWQGTSMIVEQLNPDRALRLRARVNQFVLDMS
jgi:hypothetical protein